MTIMKIDPKRILVPHDFSDPSSTALSYGASLALHFDAELLLAYVAEKVPFPVELGKVDGFLDELQGRARARLREVAKKALPATLTVRTEALIGNPAEALVELARQEDCDLIVMGTHGYTGVKHAVLGSTAEKVVRTAGRPVLTVPHG